MAAANTTLNVLDINSTSEEETVDPNWFPIAYLVIGSIGTTINLLVCIVLLKHVHKKPFTKRYSLNLSVGNTMYSVAAISLYLAWPASVHLTQGLCTFLIIIFLLSYYTCVLSMLLLAIERICAVRFPLYFRKMTSSTNITIQLATSWCLAVILAVYPAHDYKLAIIATEFGPLNVCEMAHPEEMGVYTLLLDLIAPVTVFIVLTVWAIIALNKRSAVAAVGAAQRSTGNVASMRRSKLYLIFLTVMFSLCFGPYFIFSVLDLAMKTFKDEGIYGYIRLICILLTFSHTWINPIMQWTCDKSFRKDAVRTYCCREHKEREVSRETGVPITIS